MKVYISQLTETKNIIDILKKYDVGLEIVQFAHPYYLDNQDEYIEIYKEELGDLFGTIDLGVHGPFADLCAGSRDDLIVDVTKYRYKQAFDVAKKLQANYLVLHSGYYKNGYIDIEWMRNSTKFWKEFAKELKDEKISTYIENVFEENHFKLSEFFEAIKDSGIYLCLDVGHVNAYTDENINSFIKTLKKYIKHLHIHNNKSDRDSHRGINKGDLNIIEILNIFRNSDVSISLEIVDIDELRESLEILYKNQFIKLRE